MQVVRVGHVEGIGPANVGLHERHDLAYLRRQFVHRCCRLAQRVEKHLKYLVRVHAQRVAYGIQQHVLVGRQLHTHSLILAIFSVIAHCAFVY